MIDNYVNAAVEDKLKYIVEQEVDFVQECMRDYMPWWLRTVIYHSLGTPFQRLSGKLMVVLGYTYDIIDKRNGSGIGYCQTHTLIFRRHGRILNIRELVVE